MSSNDFAALVEKYKKKQPANNLGIDRSGSVKVQSSSSAKEEEFFGLVDKYKKKKQDEDDIAPVSSRIKDRITVDAPVKDKEDDSLLDFFQKGSFKDGFDWHDIPTAILGTTGDIGLNVVKGVGGLAEGLVDLGSYAVSGAADLVGADEFAQRLKVKAQENFLDDRLKGAEDYLNQYSVLGRTSDAIMQGVGQVGAILLTGGLGAAAGLGTAGVTALTTGVMGLSGMGSGMGEAYKGGATDGEAVAYGAMAGAADAAWELVFGGLGKAINAVGFSKGLSSLDDIAAKGISKFIKSPAGKNITEAIVKSGFEGFEEVGAGFTQALAKKLSYMSEAEFGEIVKDENLLEQFLVGTFTSGITQTSSVHQANKAGVDYVTGQTQNEQAVVKKEIENRIAEAEKKNGKKLTAKEKSAIEAQVEKDLEKGYISTDTIEEVLGGEDYKKYKETVDSENALEEKQKALQDEFNTLNKMKQGDMTGEQIDRRTELKEELAKLKETIESTKNHSPRELLKQRLGESVSEMVRSDRLIESYNERSRRGQAFEADLTKYDDKQKAVVQKAIDSGILNNTNRTHEFVDMVAKISADKGVLFDFSNNAKLKESGFAVAGKTVNGFYDPKTGNIVVNIDSAASRRFVVGHEITHVLEGTALYTELQNTIFEYAKTKGDYQSRFDSLSKMYEKIEGADINAELTADLVGEYLFNDSDFINNLSTNNRNVFEKIYDEIKYLLKVATAGSKEARELERVKKAFEDAYREVGKASGDRKYSLSEIVADDGTSYGTGVRLDSTLLDNLTPEERVGMVKEYVKELGGESFTAYDPSGNEVAITIAKSNARFKNQNGRSVPVNKDLTNKYIGNEVKQEAIALVDELVIAAGFDGSSQSKYPHGWLDNNGQNNWEYWKTYIQDKNNTIWEATLNVANSANGEKILYDISPIKKVGQSVKSDTSLPDTKIAQNGSNVKLSLSDSSGRQLTNEQQEFFKDSVVRDENGNLKVMYHGTSKGGYTVFDTYGSNHGLFGAGSYFTDSKAIAESYTKKGKGKNPQVYETYLNIKNPIDMDAAADPAAWAKAFPDADFPESGTNEDFYRAMEEYFEDNEYSKWEAADIAVEAIEGMGYDGVTHIGGGRVNADGERHQVYIALHPEQIKNVSNRKPTSDPDIRFSLSNAVEETKDLLAMHNITSAQLSDVLNRNSLIMPSFAVTNKGMTDFGEITLLFDKNSIDPSVDPNNKLYGADAWTPTQTAIKKNAQFDAEKTSDVVDSIKNNIGEEYATELFAATAEQFQDAISQADGNVYEAYAHNVGMQTAYAMEKGIISQIPVNADGTVNTSALQKQLNKELDTDNGWRQYKRWLNNISDTVITSFDVATNEDILSNMKSQPATAKHFKLSESGELVVPAVEYSSIDELRRNKGRLSENANEATKEVADEFLSLANEIDGNITDVVDAINTAFASRYSVADIVRTFGKMGIDISNQTAKELQGLYKKAVELPTLYFEAKPGRQVGLNEVVTAVVPNNVDGTLKQALLDRGYKVAEYDPNVEGDRQRVVNSFDEYKFSLSNVGEQQSPVSDPLNELRLETAPVAEDIAPVAENATVAPEVAISEKETTRDMFPDEPTAQAELDNLLQEQEELEARMLDMANSGDFSEMESIDARWKEVRNRIGELENEISETESARLDSINDEDVPPEMDAPYFGESNNTESVPDPFEGRDMDEVAKNRKVKAYQYENPEVKPFFQEAANAMIGDLNETVRGEKIFNGDVYYESGGENGWMGTKRQTTEDIAWLKDTYGYTYDQIRDGVNAIIEDDGKENNAVSKRIEFLLHERLVNGYTGVWGDQLPPNQEYINFLKEREINEYSKEAFDSFMTTADQYAPEEDIAPIAAPVAKTAAEVTEDIAPTYDVVGQKNVPDGQQAFLPDAAVPEKITRKVLHKNIVENVKSEFATKGFDFDKVLKDAKNLSTFATVDNTPQRVMEKALGYKAGGVLADLTVNKVAQNETEGIKWLNSFTDRKNGLLAQISKQYNIKPGSKQSAAAQMYAEGFYVGENDEIISYGDRELAIDFPDAKVQQNIKGLANDPRIRKIYDETLSAINESRTRNAYPEIPRLDNYFLHFRAMEDTFSRLGLPFNPNDIRAKDLPTDLNGVTADLKPGQPYFASAMHRTGKRTSFDLLGGLEKYLSSAKNQIYHIDDIQTLRALRNYVADTYGQANGLEGLDALNEEEAQQRIEQVYNSHLSTFAKFLNEEANVLAGKTALIDRGLEGIIGRRGITFLNTVNGQVGKNMVGYNISSSLTNFLPVAQTFAKTNKADFTKAFAQTVGNKIGSIFGRNDGFMENSPVAIRRKGADTFYRTAWQKISDPGYALMSAVDDISTELIARTKYNEFTRKGMTSQQAHIETDKWVSRLMGDRSLGQQPQLYNSKMLGLLTKFQLEVRNQLDSQFYDTIQETKVSNEDIKNGLLRNAKTAAKVGSTFFQLAVVQHLFGKAFESVAGYNPAFDIIEVLMKAFGWDDEEESEDTVLDNIEQGFFALLEDLPYTSTLTGGRIPISSALPITELIKGEDQYGNEKSRWDTLGEVAPYYLMPGGYGQVKKSVAGLNMFDDDLPIAGSYTDSGSLRFPVEDTPLNRAQAAIFGQWANENAGDYIDNKRSPLKEKQIQEFMDVDIPIRDYWEYREGLSGLDNLSEQADYINGLDLPISKKNLLINNLAGRKEPIDLTGYDNFGSFDEFDFAVKNPEKYEIAQAVGGYENYIAYREGMKDMKLAEKVNYVAGLDLTTEQKNILINGETDRKEPIDLTGYENFTSFEEFEFAKANPETYAVAKAVGGYDSYKKYSSDLNDIKSDKDKYGQSISGSRKTKVMDYINGLDADYYTKLILYKSEYTSYDAENYEIIEYLNERDDISSAEMRSILLKLGFKVDSEGNISW